MFDILGEDIDIGALKKRIKNSKAGAMVSFEGWVRDHNDGRSVQRLEYEIYHTLARSEAKKILSETLQRFEVLDIVAVHREGQLDVGDLAVWVGVSSVHRGPAFNACGYLIDEIKTRLPIWKKEHYLDGPAEWVNCQGCYSRSRPQ